MSSQNEIPSVIDDEYDPSTMVIIAMFGFLLCLPLLLVLFFTFTTAYTRTLAWQKDKEKAQQCTLSSETETLMKTADSDGESDLDPADSDDEAEIRLREEKRRDLTLTTRQYFWKQVRRAWKGDGNLKDVQKAKEREERKKLARAIAKELVRLEKRKNRVVAEKPHVASVMRYGGAVRDEKKD